MSQGVCDCRCTFSNCQHLDEPGCCVREHFERHPFYYNIYHDIKEREQRDKERSASKKKREGNVRFKTRAGGMQAQEALLSTKKHRRVNRRQVTP